MAHAERCPVCHGAGTINKDPYATGIINESCYGCQGRGWVTVQDERPSCTCYTSYTDKERRSQ